MISFIFCIPDSRFFPKQNNKWAFNFELMVFAAGGVSRLRLYTYVVFVLQTSTNFTIGK